MLDDAGEVERVSPYDAVIPGISLHIFLEEGIHDLVVDTITRFKLLDKLCF